MVLTIDGHSDIGVHVQSDYLIFVRHLLKSTALTNFKLYQEGLYTCATRYSQMVLTLDGYSDIGAYV